MSGGREGNCEGLGDGVGVGVTLGLLGLDLDLAGWRCLTGPVGKMPDCQGQGLGKRGRIGLDVGLVWVAGFGGGGGGWVWE